MVGTGQVVEDPAIAPWRYGWNWPGCGGPGYRSLALWLELARLWRTRLSLLGVVVGTGQVVEDPAIAPWRCGWELARLWRTRLSLLGVVVGTGQVVEDPAIAPWRYGRELARLWRSRLSLLGVVVGNWPGCGGPGYRCLALWLELARLWRTRLSLLGVVVGTSQVVEDQAIAPWRCDWNWPGCGGPGYRSLALWLELARLWRTQLSLLGVVVGTGQVVRDPAIPPWRCGWNWPGCGGPGYRSLALWLELARLWRTGLSLLGVVVGTGQVVEDPAIAPWRYGWNWPGCRGPDYRSLALWLELARLWRTRLSLLGVMVGTGQVVEDPAIAPWRCGWNWPGCGGPGYRSLALWLELARLWRTRLSLLGVVVGTGQVVADPAIAAWRYGWNWPGCGGPGYRSLALWLGTGQVVEDRAIAAWRYGWELARLWRTRLSLLGVVVGNWPGCGGPGYRSLALWLELARLWRTRLSLLGVVVGNWPGCGGPGYRCLALWLGTGQVVEDPAIAPWRCGWELARLWRTRLSLLGVVVGTGQVVEDPAIAPWRCGWELARLWRTRLSLLGVVVGTGQVVEDPAIAPWRCGWELARLWRTGLSLLGVVVGNWPGCGGPGYRSLALWLGTGQVVEDPAIAPWRCGWNWPGCGGPGYRSLALWLELARLWRTRLSLLGVVGGNWPGCGGPGYRSLALWLELARLWRTRLSLLGVVVGNWPGCGGPGYRSLALWLGTGQVVPSLVKVQYVQGWRCCCFCCGCCFWFVCCFWFGFFVVCLYIIGFVCLFWLGFLERNVSLLVQLVRFIEISKDSGILSWARARTHTHTHTHL